MVDEDTLWHANDTDIEQVDIATGVTGTIINMGVVVHGMTLGPDGNVYAFADGPSVIRIATASPYTQTTVINPGDGGLQNEYGEGMIGIEFGPDGNLYVISERNTGSEQSTIKRYDGDTFAYIDDFIPEDSGLWYDLGFHTDGYLYVTDHNSGIIRFDAQTGAADGQYSNDPGAYSLDFGPNGDVILTILNGDVLRYTAPFTSTVIYGASSITKIASYLPPACYDWGDAANSGSIGLNAYTHPIVAAANGARHLIQFDAFAGLSIDAENNGQPNATATGDDATDDENGLSLSATSVTTGTSVNATFTADGRGVSTPQDCSRYLNVWVDLNGDGDWSDTGEQVVDGHGLGYSCSYGFSFAPTATNGPIMIRTRYSSVRDLATTGGAADGEVEDYVLGITTTSTPTPTPSPTPTPTTTSTAPSSSETQAASSATPTAPATGVSLASVPAIVSIASLVSVAGVMVYARRVLHR
jgi:hypothetical protein